MNLRWVMSQIQKKKKIARKFRGFSEKQTIGYIHKIFRNASTPLMYRMMYLHI